MNFRSVGKPGYLLGLFVALLLLCGRTDAAENHLVRGGKAECAVVVEPKAGEFYGIVGQEIQRYIATLTGASPAIVAPDQVTSLDHGQVLILVGGPEANPLVKKAETAARVELRS